MKRTVTFLSGLFITVAAGADTALVVMSPQKRNCIMVSQQADEFCYSVSHDGYMLLSDSRLGLHLDNYTWERALARRNPQYSCWMNGFTIDSVSHAEHRAVIRNFYGERSEVPDNYNSGTLHLSKHDGSDYRLDIEVRAYEEGVAFRYFFPEHPLAIFHKVVADLTEYTFPSGTRVWAAEWAQAPYALKPVGAVTSPIERAVTVALPGDRYCALADADVDDWCLEKNVASSVKPNTLVTTMYSPVDIVTYYATPWKVVLTGDSYAQLLEHRYLIDNLNPPCAIADAADWVRPGTIMRCTELTTEAGLRGIDFCAEHNIPYMLFDWKWYVPCTSHDGDATKAIPQLDLQRVVAYGRQKGVGIWLYVNQHALMRQARQLFPLLREWGIVGVKSGFVEYASHRWATWLHDLVRLAAENHLLMNIHDEYRPSGFSRTYPNLLTQEGIRGNEEWPSATHNTILPFTRMINGAADYTICYYDRRLKNTHGHQLAASLVFYSPLQTIFWYDRPEMAHGEPELDWFDHLPTTWDESRVLGGSPGEYVSMARRSGNDWYIAVMTNDERRTVTLSLDFLAAGHYAARFYTDDATVDTQTHIAVSEQKVKAPMRKPLTLNLQPSGGAVIRLTPLP
ncbi:MAG: glycoside hydrolase family 97 catalytic domain-containing protein [Prevotella sp.]|nr:glycoside hydrolase family 97 catalytic domain-containing protein [Prevotella sp.]